MKRDEDNAVDGRFPTVSLAIHHLLKEISMGNKKVLKTRICEMLGIEYPIFLAGMGWTAGPKLTAAVSNAGGFGVLFRRW